MKKVFIVITLLFSFSAFAEHKQGVCEDKNYTDSSKFKCWWGTNEGDTMTTRAGMVWVGLRDRTLASVGTYDKTHTHLFYGLGGDDEIIGGDLGDIISGGDEHDMIRGGKGNDFIYGDNGWDTLYGEQDKDHLIGGPDASNDYLNGGSEDDYLDGGLGQNGTYGGPGKDTLMVNANDTNILPDDEGFESFVDQLTIYGAKNALQVTARMIIQANDIIKYKEQRP